MYLFYKMDAFKKISNLFEEYPVIFTIISFFIILGVFLLFRYKDFEPMTLNIKKANIKENNDFDVIK